MKSTNSDSVAAATKAVSGRVGSTTCGSGSSISKTYLATAAAALCLGLGACGSEPSEVAMRDALGRSISRIFQQQAAVTAFVVGARGAPPAPTVTEFRKLGCVPSDRRPAHQCEFTFAMNGVDRGASKAWFYKAEDGLLAMSD